MSIEPPPGERTAAPQDHVAAPEDHVAGPPDRAGAPDTPLNAGADRPSNENAGMTLARASWSLTALVLLVAGAILLLEGYVGYAIVTLVISAAAAINLL